MSQSNSYIYPERYKTTERLFSTFLILPTLKKAHTHDLSVHPRRAKMQLTQNYCFPKTKTSIAIRVQNCLKCQNGKEMPNLFIAPNPPFLEVSLFLTSFS